jgi:phage-related baseplate assembly protein
VAQPGAAGSPTYSNTTSLTIPPSPLVGTVTGAVGSGGLVKLTASGSWTVGQTIFVSGVLGTTEANGAWTVAATDGTTYVTLAGSVFTNAWSSGGTQGIYTPTLAAFAADAKGSKSNALANTVNHPVTSLILVSVSNLVPFIATDIEANGPLAARALLKLSALSVNGPTGAFLYYALTSQQVAPTLTPPLAVASAITRALAQLDYTTGIVTTTIANAAGSTNDSDLAAVTAVEDAFTGFSTKVIQWAAQHATTVAVTIYVPLASAAAVVPVVQVAVSTYLSALPLGGISDPSGAQNVLPIEGVRGAIEVACAAASIKVQDLAVTLNGVAANVQLLLIPVPEIAFFTNQSTFVPTVVPF